MIGDLQWFIKPLVLTYGMIYLLDHLYSNVYNKKLLNIL